MNRINDNKIGNILRDIRNGKGVSQEQLAQQLNKGQSDIAKIESGLKRVSLIDFLSWCKNLGMTIEETSSLIEVKFKELWKINSLWADE